jgi:hypothetical protein
MDADDIRRILGSVNIDQSSTIIQKDGNLLRVHITISKAANGSTIMARMVELIERAGGKVTEFSYRATDSSLTLTIGTT